MPKLHIGDMYLTPAEIMQTYRELASLRARVEELERLAMEADALYARMIDKKIARISELTAACSAKDEALELALRALEDQNTASDAGNGELLADALCELRAILRVEAVERQIDDSFNDRDAALLRARGGQ